MMSCLTYISGTTIMHNATFAMHMDILLATAHQILERSLYIHNRVRNPNTHRIFEPLLTLFDHQQQQALTRTEPRHFIHHQTVPHSAKDTAFDSTEDSLAANHHVFSSTTVTNATNQVTQPLNASLTPALHFGLEPANPLPTSIVTPVNINNLQYALSLYPNIETVSYLINGFTYGFDIGYVGPSIPSHPRNLLSSLQHPLEIEQAICKELSRGHTSGPFNTPPWPYLHCSPLGCTIKPDGSHRLILDLSQPTGISVNEYIDKEDFTVKYNSFDAATELVRNIGHNCLMTKLDIKHAFRIMPVKPSQWPLLGTHWKGFYFVDTRLPFGLRSSPAIFNQFADAVCWSLQHNVGLRSVTHYSDDFFFVSSPNQLLALADITTAEKHFHHLGIPLSPDKKEGPSTSITYLGINIDSSNFIMSIPHSRYTDTITMLEYWDNRRKCTKKELLSLIGKLAFLCKIVRHGCIFLRRLIALSTTVTHLHHRLYLNANARADIQWWHQFLPSWKETSIIPEPFTTTNKDLHLFTDSSKMGMGAIYGTQWIMDSTCMAPRYSSTPRQSH